MAEKLLLSRVFAEVVSEGVEPMLEAQRADGTIVFDPALPIVYGQQGVMPLAFCYAGYGTNPEHKKSAKIEEAIRKLAGFLVARFDDQGRVHYDSHGYDVNTVDQRLTYAWTEGLRMMRDVAKADMPYEKWGDKILRACHYLVEHRMAKLVGLRRFISRVLGTSTNHVAHYVSTVYRAGQVLGKRELCDFALPIGRALAADIHPDGYWEEHGDLLRRGGPTPSYNYLTLSGMALMYEWTGEQVFADAIAKATAFHGNFSYPDGSFNDLMDERVRYDALPRVWGLFGFSHTAAGRGMALQHMENWLSLHAVPPRKAMTPESLARHCENFLYWHDGPVEMAAYQRADHQALLHGGEAGVFRKGKWYVGLSAMPATNGEDPAYRNNPFGLDRQKLLSVWHEKTGLILDGSHSKDQRAFSTFAARAEYADDFYPAGGQVVEEGREMVAKVAYKTFFAEVRVREVAGGKLEIELGVDPAGNRGPFAVGFTLRRIAEVVRGFNGKELSLGREKFVVSGEELGGGFTYGGVRIEGVADMRVSWPLSPFNSYAKSGQSSSSASQVKVETELTMERRKMVFVIAVD
ncbi:MAG: hypothetical protein FWD61_15495 [Phycisphaerales bacterium]|nr:hypothetical protein [Phycisphaerales bacterium]